MIYFISMILWPCLIMTLGGCASLGGNKQLVSVDSSPRGATVYLQGEKDPIGVTPFFYPLARVPSDSMEFHFPEIAPTSVHIDCHYRWGIEAGLNAPLMLISPVAGLAALGIDLATGAAFDCGSSVFAQASAPATTSAKVVYCKKYLISPPEDSDEETSDWQAESWIKQSTFSLRGCDQMIDYKTGKQSLEYVNITHQTPMGTEKLGREKLNEQAQFLGATHIVLLTSKTNGESFTLTAKTKDLHTIKDDESIVFPGVVLNGSNAELSATEKVLRYSVSFSPNSVTFGQLTSEPEITAHHNSRIIDISDVSRLPVIISAWGLTTVDHSGGYAHWDAALDFYPSMQINNVNKKITLLNVSSNVEKSRELQFLNLMPLYHAGVSFYTPIGAFSVDAGAGLSSSIVKITGSPTATRTDPSFSLGVEYRAFFTNSIFFQMGTYQVLSGNRNISAGQVKISPAPVVTYLQLGYFAPEIRQSFRQAISRKKTQP
jgi:hypothetical protein